MRQVSQGLRIRIVHKHVTSKSAEHPGHAGADRAVADQTGGGILQLQSALVVFVVIATPFASRERRVRFWNAAQHSEDQAHGVLGGGRSVAAGGVADEYAVLGRRLDVSVGRTSARDDGKFQVGRACENFFGEWSMVRHVDAHPLKSLDELVLRAARFRDLADIAKGHARPRGLIFAELNGGVHLGADRVGKDGRQDEMIAGDKNACTHEEF